MAAEQVPRPMALCELCYLDENTKWEPESMDENGQILMRLVGVEVPNKVNTDAVETCCMCGNLTISGIYEMRIPTEVYFLDTDDVDNKFVLSLDDDEEEDF